MEPGYTYIKDRISPIYHSSSSKAVASLPLLAKKLVSPNNSNVSGIRKDGDKDDGRVKERLIIEGRTNSSGLGGSPGDLVNGLSGGPTSQTNRPILPKSNSTSHFKNNVVMEGDGAGSNNGAASVSHHGSPLAKAPTANTSGALASPPLTSQNGKSGIPKTRSRTSRSISPTLVNTHTNSSMSTAIATATSSTATVPVNGHSSAISVPTVCYIMVDTTAVACLTNEQGSKIVEKSIELEGYEVYIVEQWACERKLNATITSYTGNPAHKIKASILSLPKDTNLWSDVVRAHFEELFKLHLRPKETGQGLLFVSNLSSFPSNLNLVPVPEGDVSKAVEFFDVNEDLRRTGCGGRLVLTIGTPPDSCSDKFKQLFKTHDKVPIMFAVRELVTLVQIGLFYCNLLQPSHVDGLLCNSSVRAISSWWDEIGKMRYHAYPKDGVLGPTTVAAIIGFIIGIRSRLASLNYKPPKDPFDAEEFVLCIKQFQKHERLPRTMRLDNETVRRIYSMTSSKGTNSDLFGIVKSTMKEVSGKQVQNVADAEVLDLERLLSHLQGHRARYLWLGKGHMRTIMTNGSSSTGIPCGSLSVPELSSTNLDIKKAMRSVRKPTQVRSRMGNGGNSNRSSVATSLGSDADLYDEDQQHNSSRVPATLMEEQPWIYDTSTKQQRMAGSKRSHRFKKYLSVSTNNGNGGTTVPTTANSFRSPYSTSDEEIVNGANYETSDEEGEDIANATTNENDKDNNELCPFESDRFICCQQAHDDCSFGKFMDNDQKRMDRYNLRRTQSFSIVEEVVLKWNFDRPAPKLAKTYLSAMRTRQKLVGEVSLLGDISQMYDQKIKSMSLFLNKDRVLVNGLNSRVQGVMEKEINVKNLVNDVDALVARLQYESRMLTSKLRDVEESVDSFASRVTDLEVRIDHVDKKKECLGDIPQEYGYTESLLKRYLGWLPPLQKYLTP